VHLYFFENTKRRLGVDELHASELPDEELCRFIVGGPLSLIAQVTDTEVMTDEQISQYRNRQAAVLGRNLATTRKRAGSGREPRPSTGGTSSAPHWRRASITASTCKATCSSA